MRRNDDIFPQFIKNLLKTRNYSTFLADQCGQSHLYSPGTLKSPFYPNLYPNNLDCNWTVSSSNEKRILLQFSFFSVGHVCLDQL